MNFVAIIGEGGGCKCFKQLYNVDMKKEAKILKADHDPVKVGDNVLIVVKTKPRKHKTPTLETDNPSSNQPPLRSVVTVLQQTVEKLAEEMHAGFKVINTRLNKQDEFNQVVTNYMQSHL